MPSSPGPQGSSRNGATRVPRGAERWQLGCYRRVGWRRYDPATPPIRRRLDAELVRRKLVPTREEARDLIEDGRVTVGGAPALNPSRQVRADEPVLVADDALRFVSRAGDKLAAALERFGLDVDGLRVLDAGASTGGFTDCLLQKGAHHVAAVDVGYGLIHEGLRKDDRVEVHERTNVRDLQPGDLGEPFDLVVADLSFISLRTVLPNLLGQAKSGGLLVVLVKPQFEATKAEASRGRGVIRDPEVWRRVLNEVTDEARQLGARVLGGAASPVRGAEGNVEFLVLLTQGNDDAIDVPPFDVDRLVTEATSLVAG